MKLFSIVVCEIGCLGLGEGGTSGDSGFGMFWSKFFCASLFVVYSGAVFYAGLGLPCLSSKHLLTLFPLCYIPAILVFSTFVDLVFFFPLLFSLRVVFILVCV